MLSSPLVQLAKKTRSFSRLSLASFGLSLAICNA
jgi:hypothetical protein